MKYFTTYNSPLGELTITSNGNSINEIMLNKNINNVLVKKPDLPIFIDTKNWLDDYFSRKNPDINRLKLNPTGTPYQKEIWKILSTVSYGKTTTYGEVAKKYEEITNNHTSPRAVGGAVGKNPILIAIPCHRVIGKNGKLTGFSAGIENKIKLLKIENIKQSRWKPTFLYKMVKNYNSNLFYV